jgi:hypothetical protein
MTDKIKRGLAAKRDAVCYQTTQDITIPAGTILRANAAGKHVAAYGLNVRDAKAEFVLELTDGAPVPFGFKRVVA